MESFDLVIIGSGPGGYVAAIRATQLGLRVALVEKEPVLGGTCLNIGCIPSKALLESSGLYALVKKGLAEHGLIHGEVALDLSAMMARKRKVVETLTQGIDLLMKKNKVIVFRGFGQLKSGDRVRVIGESEELELSARSILLATGSVPMALPDIPFDGKSVLSSTEVLSLEKVPGHLLVVGAGAVGLELGLVWRRLGAKVSVVEMLPQIAPFADRMLSNMLKRSLMAQGMEFQLSSKVTAADPGESGLIVTVEDNNGKSSELACDQMMIAIGRQANLEGLGLSEAGVALDERGRISVNQSLQTSVESVYAIGDLTPGPMLAHKAEEEGIAVAERLAGSPGHVNYEVIPGVVYTSPELAQVGITEEQAKQQGQSYRTGKFYFRANGRALASGEADGLVKLIADKESDRLLGVHILGAHASELIAEAVVTMEYSGSAEDLARTVHAHPTLSEAVREAALAVDGRAIHS